MQSNDSVRLARVTDLPLVYLGELDYIRQIEPHNEARWKDGMRWHIQQWTSNLERMFIVEAEAEMVGYCFWQVDQDAAVLASICVQREQRGRGLGRQLLARFISDAQARGFDKLTLGVQPDNPARHLYEKTGFVYTHEADGYRHYAYAAALG